MSKTTMIVLAVGVLLFGFFTCAGIGAFIYTTMPNPLPAPNLADTQLAEMINSALTVTAQARVPTLALITIPSATPPVTATPMLPPGMATSTATLPPFSLFTPTPGVPQISVSLATNCRVGPGKIYDRVGYLQVGQVSEVYGRNSAGNYWYIRNLNDKTAYCWLWGEYATVSGDTSALPVYTPPPSPTPAPSFIASYAGKDNCAGWWVDMRLENTGSVTFQSVAITVRDTLTNVSLTSYTDGFSNSDGCVDLSIEDSLLPGEKLVVSSPAFTYDPAGHLMRATITGCSNRGQSGTCVTKVIEFEP